MTIAKRLVVLLAVPIVALLGLGIFVRLQVSKIEQQARFLAETQIPSLAGIGELSRDSVELRVHVRNHLLATNQTEQAKAQAAFETNEAEISRLFRQYADKLISDDQDRRLFNEYQ